MINRTVKQPARPRKAVSTALKLRKAIKSRKPSFKRQEGYRHVKLADSWRRPRGKHSKLRMREKARGSLPGAGYGSPREARGLNRLGYSERLCSTPSDLESLDPKEEMAVLSSTLGRKKREGMIKLAKDRGIKVSNA